MKKKDLFELLKDAPDEAEVYFYDRRENEYHIADVAYFAGEIIVLEENDI